MTRRREPFTPEDDALLVKYIATYAPAKEGRMGNNLYKDLVEDTSGRWPWSKRHTWQSWRERYKTNEGSFDVDIRKYQRKRGIRVPEKNKRRESMFGYGKGEKNVAEEPQEKEPRPLVPVNAARKTVRMVSDEMQENGSEKSRQKRQAANEAEGVAAREAKRQRLESASASPAHNSDDERGPHSSTAAEVNNNNALSQKRVTVDHGMNDDAQDSNHIDRQEAAVQVSSMEQSDAYQSVNEKLIATLKEIGKSMDKEQLENFIRSRKLDEDIQAMILAEIQEECDNGSESGDHELQMAAEANGDGEQENADVSMVYENSPQGQSRETPPEATETPFGVEDELRPEFEEDHQVLLGDATMVPSQEVNAKTNGRKKRRQDNDYFASDTDSLPPMHSASLPKTNTNATLSRLSSSKRTGRTREPLRSIDRSFKLQYALGKRIGSGRPAPDMGSDAESAKASASAAVEVPPAASWPPPRQKKTQTRTRDESGDDNAKKQLDEEGVAPQPPVSSKIVTQRRGLPARPGNPADMLSSDFDRQGAQHTTSGTNSKETGELRLHVPGPSRLPLSQGREQQAKVRSIREWREKMNASSSEDGVGSLGAPTPTSQQPAAKIDFEGALSHQKASGISSRADSNRRRTFGGFTGRISMPSKEIDLRKKVARRSLASSLPGPGEVQSRLPSFSPAAETVDHSIGKRSRRSSMASAVDSTIALLTDSELPDVPISRRDEEMAIRIGFSHIFKAMSDNYGVPEQWLRDTYKLVRSIRKTDELGRVAAIAAELVDDEAVDGEEQEEDMGNDEDEGDAESSPAPNLTQSTEAALEEQMPLRSSSNSRRRVELDIMPADEDSLPRIRERYSPPRPSRAAKYTRLKKEGREDEAKERERRRASSRSPYKRLETERVISSPMGRSSLYSGSGADMSPNLTEVPNAPEKQKSSTEGEAWTEQEDRIIMEGTDLNAIREIERRRGEGSVRKRQIDLMEDEF